MWFELQRNLIVKFEKSKFHFFQGFWTFHALNFCLLTHPMDYLPFQFLHGNGFCMVETQCISISSSDLDFYFPEKNIRLPEPNTP